MTFFRYFGPIEIISILKEYDIYDNYKIKLRHAAFIAMQKDIAMFKNE